MKVLTGLCLLLSQETAAILLLPLPQPIWCPAMLTIFRIFLYTILLPIPPLWLAIPMMASRAMAIAQLGRVKKLPFHIMDVR